MASGGMYLQWEGKRVYRQRIPTPRVLEYVPLLSVGDHSQNLIIEGDNLQVLASLKSRYGGLIDVAYIDPPYNLGTNDFRYSDKRFYDPDADDDDAVYVNDKDGGRHTKWLNFMAPRLHFLWQLLHDERGVIFVSINDNELYRLGMLMNEIFDEKNHLGTLIWKGSTDNNPTRIASEHEYILCYAKNKDKLPAVWKGRSNEARDLMLEEYERIKDELSGTPTTTRAQKAPGAPIPAEIQKHFRKFIRNNSETLGALVHYSRVDEHGVFTGSRKVHNPGKEGYRYDVIHPKTKQPCKQPARGYRFPPETMQELIAADKILYGKDEHQIVQIKVYLHEYVGSLKSVITHIDSRTGANTLAELFGDRNLFRNPKPVELIELLLDYASTPTSIVLDAFAGSGTTAHALMKLNKADGGQRRFIMIEEGKNGDKFCRTLTAERVKRAIKAYDYDGGFTFYTSGRKIDRDAIIDLERDSLVSLICQADETGRGKGITRLNGHKYIVGRNHRNEAICLVWNGESKGEVSKDDLRKAADEVTAAGLKRPFRIYGKFCLVADTASWKFCKIPDEILAQMHIQEDLGDEE